MRNSADLISPCTQNHRIALIGKDLQDHKIQPQPNPGT